MSSNNNNNDGLAPDREIQKEHNEKPKTKTQKQAEVLKRRPLPAHWRKPDISGPFSLMGWALFNPLCLLAFGHAGMERIWSSIRQEEEGDEGPWEKWVEVTCDRFGNVILVESLLLATACVLISTPPPKLSMLDYLHRVPYFFLLCSSGLLIGSIFFAAVCILAVRSASPKWSEDVLYGNLARVWCTLIMFSYPVYSLGLATAFLAIAVFSAVWCAQDRLMQIASVASIALLAGISVPFGLTCLIATVKASRQKNLSQFNK